jgi:transcriptional regulator with XRE-family HTH domain
MREARGWSQTKLSIKSGVPQTTISAIETGKICPTVKPLKKLASALGCKVSDLIDDIPEEAGCL